MPSDGSTPAGGGGVDRRRFMAGGLSLGAVAAVGHLPITGRGLASSGQRGRTPRRGGSLSIGSAGHVPETFLLGHSFGVQTVAFYPMAWPLFLSTGNRDFEIENFLAASYEASADGLAHAITLRHGLTFHDGSPIDADAVAEVLRSYFFEDHQLRDDGDYILSALNFGFPPAIESVEVVDELTVAVTLTEPRVDIRDPLWQMPIMNPAVLARSDYGTDVGALRDAGSGPFRLTNFSPASFVEYERFDGFFEEVLLDRLRFQRIGDTSAIALALRSGEIDVALDLPRSDYDELTADPGYDAYVAAPGRNVFLAFQTPRAPALEDRRVREAIWLAMNRDAYADAFFGTGTALPSTQPVVVPGVLGYNADIEARPYDPQRARELLAEAGVDSLQISTINPPAIAVISELTRLVEAIAFDLAEVGIELDITVTDEATAGAELPNHDLNITFYGNGFSPVIIFSIFFGGLGEPWDPADPRADPDVERLLSAALDSVDREEQGEAFDQLMQLNHEQLLMGIPIAIVGNSAIARKGVRDLSLTWLTALGPLHRVWIDG